MNPLLALGLLWGWREHGSSVHKPARHGAYPTHRITRKHPPPHTVVAPPMPPMPHEHAHDAHKTPAHQVHTDDHHVDTHKPVEHHSPAHDATHEHEEAVPVRAAKAPAPIQRPRPRVTRLPVQHIRARVPAPAPGSGGVRTIYTVDEVQGVLRGLGWKGHLTTKGPLSKNLTDGLYGATTHDDYVQSATKRGLDPQHDRVDGQHVRLNPQTFATLRSVGGGVSGIYIPR